MEYLSISSHIEPGSIYTIFMKIKVLLTKGAVEDSLQEIEKMMACEDFELDFLRVINRNSLRLECNAVSGLQGWAAPTRNSANNVTHR
jgi:hypothetical protein